MNINYKYIPLIIKGDNIDLDRLMLRWSNFSELYPLTKDIIDLCYRYIHCGLISENKSTSEENKLYIANKILSYRHCLGCKEIINSNDD